MGAPRATNPHHSAAIDRRINDLELRGHTMTDIAAMLSAEGVPMSKQAVSARIKRLNAAARADRDAQVARELRTLDYVQREAMDAWERSLQDAETVTTEAGGAALVVDLRSADAPAESPAALPTAGGKVTSRVEGQSGNASHLANILRASESRRKLLGLDATPQTQVAGGLTIRVEYADANADSDLPPTA